MTCDGDFHHVTFNIHDTTSTEPITEACTCTQQAMTLTKDDDGWTIHFAEGDEFMSKIAGPRASKPSDTLDVYFDPTVGRSRPRGERS